MFFTFEKCLTFLALLVFGVVFGQNHQKAPEGQYNDISNHEEDDGKYPYQPYGFGYDIEDGHGNKQWRHEKSQEASNVIGSYGFKDKDGIMREVEYIADKNGFRARIKTNEPGTAPKDPGDVKFDAQPVMISNYVKHDEPSKESNEGHDYQPNSSQIQQKFRHRFGRIGKNSKMIASDSRPVFTFVPYYS